MDASATPLHVSRLSDEELTAEVARLAASAREVTARLVAHLAEFDARRLYLGAGFPSLFAYCREVLRLSESEAYSRIEAARVVRRFPAALERLGAGTINLTTITPLAPHLDPENHREVLAAVEGKSKREVEELVARLRPRPDVAPMVRKLPTRVVAAPPAAPVRPPAATMPKPKPSVLAPLAPDRYEVRATVGRATYDNLRLAQDLVGRNDLAEVLDRALALLVADLAKRKSAATGRPREGRATAPHSRHVPAAVKRAVWARDGGRCAFVATSGRRCRESRHLDFHHVHPWAAGGPTTVENVQLRCRAHNAYEADLFYGPINEARWPTGSGTSTKSNAASLTIGASP